MPISEWNNRVQRQYVTITTVDPRTRTVEGVMKDGVPVRVAVYEPAGLFRWPKQDEVWLVTYSNGVPTLDRCLEQGESIYPIEVMMPGEARIDAEHTIFTGSANFAGMIQTWTPDDGTNDTTVATTAFVGSAIDALATSTEFDLLAHIADTTGIHGIADTSQLALITDPRFTDAREPLFHTHDMLDVDGLTAALGLKSDVGHTHAWNDITSKPTTFAPSAHTHPQSEVTDLVSDLALKAPLASPTFSGTATAVTGLVVQDTTFVIRDDVDPTRQMRFSVGSISANTARTITIPNQTGTLTTRENTQTWTAAQTFSVAPIVPTAAVDTNTTVAASTAFVIGQGYLKAATATTTYAPITHTHLWADITDKPTTFTPSVHTHPWTEVTGKPTTFDPSTHTHTWAEVTGKPTTFAPDAHTHVKADITDFAHTHLWADITDKPTTFAPSVHNHDDLYFTEGEVATLLAGKSNTGHTHLWADLTDKPTTFAPSAHVHPMSEVTNLDTTLGLKANLASPTFTGLPAAPTATAGTNTTQIASTAFVATAVANRSKVYYGKGAPTTTTPAAAEGDFYVDYTPSPPNRYGPRINVPITYGLLNTITNPEAASGVVAPWTNASSTLPTFEVVTLGGANPPLPDPTNYPQVDTAFHAVGNGTNDRASFQIFGVTAGDVITCSLWAYVKTGSTNNATSFRIINNLATPRASLLLPNTFDTWQRHEISFTAPATEDLFINFRQMVAGAMDVYWTGILLLKGPGLAGTTYFSGDSPDGRWTGAAHTSTSERATVYEARWGPAEALTT